MKMILNIATLAYYTLNTSKSNHIIDIKIMLSGVISEHVFFKIFLGGHAPRPP